MRQCLDCSPKSFFKLEFNLAYYTVLLYESSVLYVLMSSGSVRGFALQFKDTLNFFTKILVLSFTPKYQDSGLKISDL
jgi:hypothetical protein